MSIFTIDKQLEQIRTEFTQKMDGLEQKIIKEVQQLGEAQRSYVPPEVSQVLKELGQLQEQVLTLSSLTSGSTPLLVERQADMATKIQTIEQMLIEGMQQRQVLTTLSQFSERLEQIQKQILELLQGQVGDLSASVGSTPAQLGQLEIKVDDLLSQFAQESPLLQELQRKIAEIAQLSAVPSTLERLQGQVDGISFQMASASGVLDVLRQVNERLAAELVPVIPSGEQRPDDLIHARVQKTIEAINALEQDLTTWLNRHYLALSQDDQVSDEKLMQTLASFLETYMANQQAQRFYNIQEAIPVSPEGLPSGEQHLPLLDQPGETARTSSTEG